MKFGFAVKYFIFIFSFIFSPSVGLSKNRNVILSIGSPTTDSRYYDDLKYPNDDASAVADFFGKNGWETFIIHDVTLDKLMLALGAIEEMSLSPEDQFILYFSGHGRMGNDNLRREQYLMLTDSIVGDLSLSQSVPFIANWMENSINPTRKALILSACNAAYKNIKNIKGSQVLGESYSFAILSASQPFGKAYESEQHKSCLFTHFFLKNLHASSGLVEGFDKARSEFMSYRNQYNDIASKKKHLFGQQPDLIDQLPHKTLSEAGVTSICINPEKCGGNEVAYFGVPQEYKGHVDLNGVSVKGSMKLDIKGWVTVNYTTDDGKSSSKLVKVEPGREYSLDSLIEMPEPENSIDFSFGYLSFLGHNFKSLGVSYKYRIGNIRPFVRGSLSESNYKVLEYGRKYDDENMLYKGEIGIELPRPIARINHRDFGFSSKIFGSYLYSQEKLDSFYFKDGKAWAMMPGLGIGGGLFLQSGFFEYGIDLNLTKYWNDSRKPSLLDLFFSVGGMW